MAAPERPPHAASGVAPPRAEERSIPDLISDALAEVSALLRAEFRLAKGEAARKLKQAGIGLVLLGGALVLALACVVMLLVTIMALLAAMGVPVALAALLALLVGLAGVAGLAWLGIQRLRADAVLPERTLRQLRRDRTLVREQTR